MSANGIGLTESVVFAPQTSYNSYAYRTGCGMIPSAEFTVFMDDFISGVATNVPNGWQAAIIDTAATVTTYTTATVGANGVLQVFDASVSEGAAVYGAKAVQLQSGKKFFMEARLRTDDITDNVIQFGLSDLTAVVNPEDLWTTTSANVIALGILDGSANIMMLADKGNAGSSAVDTGADLVANTWTTLAIGYDGANLSAYVNGKKYYTWATAAQIPTDVALAPFFGALNGNGAANNVNLFDYIRYVSQR